MACNERLGTAYIKAEVYPWGQDDKFETDTNAKELERIIRILFYPNAELAKAAFEGGHEHFPASALQD